MNDMVARTFRRSGEPAPAIADPTGLFADHRPDAMNGDSAAPSRARDVVEQRDWMVDTQIAGRGVRDGWVLHAFRTVPMPVGTTPAFQHLVRVTRRAFDDDAYEDLEAVAFVPLIGQKGSPETARAT